MPEIDLTPDCGDDIPKPKKPRENSLEIMLLRQVLAGQEDIGNRIDTVMLRLENFELRQDKEHRDLDARITELEEWRDSMAVGQ